MPKVRLKPEVIVDGRLILNQAIRIAGDIDKLAEHLGYERETLISQRAASTVSRFLVKKCLAFIAERRNPK